MSTSHVYSQLRPGVVVLSARDEVGREGRKRSCKLLCCLGDSRELLGTISSSWLLSSVVCGDEHVCLLPNEKDGHRVVVVYLTNRRCLPDQRQLGSAVGRNKQRVHTGKNRSKQDCCSSCCAGTFQ